MTVRYELLKTEWGLYISCKKGDIHIEEKLPDLISKAYLAEIMRAMDECLEREAGMPLCGL